MPASALDKNRRSRITAACAVCRGKRQKCSGERPVCDQCKLHNEECWWSETKKRGPAKDYLRSLQDRLQETERLLMCLLNRTSDAELYNVLREEASGATVAPSHQAWTSSMSGQDYWTQYPLNQHHMIRAWQMQRSGMSAHGQAFQPQRYPPGNQSKPFQPNVELKPPLGLQTSSGNAIPMTENSLPAGQGLGIHAGPSISHQSPESWSRPPVDVHAGLAQRRYSEETREAGEALFSISNNHRSPSFEQTQENLQERGHDQTKQPDLPQWRAHNAPPPQPTATEPGLNAATSQPQFPKHLFW